MSNNTITNSEERIGSTADNDAGLLILLWTILRMNFLLMIRYKVNFAAQIVGMYLFFAVVFFGGRAAIEGIGAGIGAIGETLDALIVGWFLWTMAQSAYSSLASEVTQESRWGTLEQLFMSPHGFGTILGVKVSVNMLISMIIGGLMLAFMLLTTGRTLTLDFVTIVPVVVLTLLTVVGIGYVFAGLALIYKQISQVSQLMQFVLIGLIAAPAAELPGLQVLPLVQGSSMLQATMREGVGLLEFAPLELAVLVGTAVLYLGGGYVAFMLCLHIARDRGVMGHY